VNTPAKAPLTRQQIIDRAGELGIEAGRLRFFDEDVLSADAAGVSDSGVDVTDSGASGRVTAAELHDYTQLTDVALRRVREPAEGLFIAESSKIIRRSHASGMVPRSYLTSPKWLFDLADVIATNDVPIYIGTDAAVESLTGFHLHRGALAAMHRPVLPDPAALVENAKRIVIIEDIVDHTNVGAIFRSAAAFGVDAVLVTPRCADPLYRRSIRVSMGTVFQVPWTRIDSWPGGIRTLQESGFHVAALALDDDSVSLREFADTAPERTAVVFGTEGEGLNKSTIAACDSTVMIPMSGGVDSLNVAAASAVTCFALQEG
jgi:tRNA G18 (ribose-2'-O)-methylase SpoU